MNKSINSSFFNKNRRLFYLMLWMSVVPWTSSFVIGYLAIANEEMIRVFTDWQWAIFFSGIIFTMGLAITPTTFISVLCGYFLGWKSVFLVVICYQFASLIGYYLSKYVNRNLLDHLSVRYPKIGEILNNVNENQWTTTVLSRISPALPFGLMNVVLAVSGVNLKQFFLGGLLGMLPRTLFFVWAGSQAPFLVEALQSNENIGWFVFSTIIVLVAFYKTLKPKP